VMQTSEAGIEFIKGNEGYVPVPKPDNGKLAWGYGHDQQPGEVPPEFISEPDADTLLRHDLATRFEPAVNAIIPIEGGVVCTQNQFDALVDFCFNLGPSALRMMTGHGWEQVPTQMLRWCHVNGEVSNGLPARRQKEVAFFNS